MLVVNSSLWFHFSNSLPRYHEYLANKINLSIGRLKCNELFTTLIIPISACYLSWLRNAITSYSIVQLILMKV